MPSTYLPRHGTAAARGTGAGVVSEHENFSTKRSKLLEKMHGVRILLAGRVHALKKMRATQYFWQNASMAHYNSRLHCSVTQDKLILRCPAATTTTTTAFGGCR